MSSFSRALVPARVTVSEGVREHRQGDVAIPAAVAADLVVIQSDLVLRGLEGLLDRPADPGDPRELTQRGVARGGGEVEGDVAGIGQAASGE
ncbi:MAG: hypothetical protein QOE59_5116 [Actinomycetota bacterium]|nr:hypothetical protein [Actinomycetota bacterium]